MASNTWNDEDTWWRNNYSSRPYAAGRTYEDFRPAYQYGFESDAWDRVTGQHDVDTDRMAEADYDRVSRGGRTQ